MLAQPPQQCRSMIVALLHEEEGWSQLGTASEVDIIEMTADGRYLCLTNKDPIGRGACGIVRQGTLQRRKLWNRDTDIEAAAKCFIGNNQEENFEREKGIMETLHHKHILCLLTSLIYQDNNSTRHYILVTELCLDHILKYVQKEHRPEDEKLRLLMEVASGCSFIAEKRYVHRDLCMRNILVKEIGASRRVEAKVGDLGFALSIDKFKKQKNVGRAGKGPYMAPEIFADAPQYSEKSDVYSFGMVIWVRVKHKHTSFVPAPSLLASIAYLEHPPLSPRIWYFSPCLSWSCFDTTPPFPSPSWCFS